MENLRDVKTRLIVDRRSMLIEKKQILAFWKSLDKFKSLFLPLMKFLGIFRVYFVLVSCKECSSKDLKAPNTLEIHSLACSLDVDCVLFYFHT